jgi:hypothetical protein
LTRISCGFLAVVERQGSHASSDRRPFRNAVPSAVFIHEDRGMMQLVEVIRTTRITSTTDPYLLPRRRSKWQRGRVLTGMEVIRKLCFFSFFYFHFKNLLVCIIIPSHPGLNLINLWNFPRGKTWQLITRRDTYPG